MVGVLLNRVGRAARSRNTATGQDRSTGVEGVGLLAVDGLPPGRTARTRVQISRVRSVTGSDCAGDVILQFRGECLRHEGVDGGAFAGVFLAEHPAFLVDPGEQVTA